MGAAKRVLSPALAANRWKRGQSGNPSGHSGEYGEAMKLARRAAPYAVQRLIELMDSEDERVATVACNAILDRAFGKPKTAEEPKDDMDAQLASMTREERLALMQELLEPMRKYLLPGEDAVPVVVDGEAVRDRTAGGARLGGPRHST